MLVLLHRFVLSVLLLSLSTQAFSDCRESYKNNVASRIEKLDKGKKIGRIITASTMGGMTVFWGVMGVLLVGPAGVLIGAQFGLFSSVIGLPFYIRNKIKKAKLNDLAMGQAALNVAIKLEEGRDVSADEQTPLVTLHSAVKKARPDLTLEQLGQELVTLNNNNALCDGTVNQKSYPATLKQTARYIKKSLK